MAKLLDISILPFLLCGLSLALEADRITNLDVKLQNGIDSLAEYTEAEIGIVKKANKELNEQINALKMQEAKMKVDIDKLVLQVDENQRQLSKASAENAEKIKLFEEMASKQRMEEEAKLAQLQILINGNDLEMSYLQKQIEETQAECQGKVAKMQTILDESTSKSEGQSALIRELLMSSKQLGLELKAALAKVVALEDVVMNHKVEAKAKMTKLEELSKFKAPASCAQLHSYGVQGNDYFYVDPNQSGRPLLTHCDLTAEPVTLVIASGFPFESSQTTEVISTNGLKCGKLPSFPVKTNDPVGDIFGHKIVLCGGWDGSSPSSECYSYSKRSYKWSRAGSLLLPRSGAASLGINGKLYITGGRDRNKNYVQSTELYDVATSTSSIGPKRLPFNVTWHCMLNIDANQHMIIGGYDGDIRLKRTFIFNANNTDQYTPGPDLQERRSSHACAILTTGHTHYAIVAGGFNKGVLKHLASVEYLDLSNIDSGWKEGPSLPRAVMSAAMVSFNDEVVLIGGEGSNEEDLASMYSLSCINEGCQWKEMDVKLDNARDSHRAFVVPHDFAHCN